MLGRKNVLIDQIFKVLHLTQIYISGIEEYCSGFFVHPFVCLSTSQTFFIKFVHVTIILEGDFINKKLKTQLKVKAIYHQVHGQILLSETILFCCSSRFMYLLTDVRDIVHIPEWSVNFFTLNIASSC